MIFELFTVTAAAFALHGAPAHPATFEVAEDARAVALELGAFPGDTLEHSACVFAAWVVLESNGDPKAIGDRDSPYGPSFGVGQIKVSHLKIAGVTFAELTTDRRASMRAAWRVMRHEIDRCGSLERGLRCYASGFPDRAIAKVRGRLALARTCG